jgi:type IV secretory pathway TrbD component
MATAIELKRLQMLIWVLIFGGLLALVLGLSVRRFEAPLGWVLMTGGAVLAAVGAALIFLRAKLDPPSPENPQLKE